MRLLKTIFSYNRFHLLRNLGESMTEFFPEGETLIIDDGSNDARLLDYLKAQQQRGMLVHRRGQRPADGPDPLGALAGQYDWLMFLQDDLQFVWRDSDLVERVAKVFSQRPDAAMVPPEQIKQLPDLVNQRAPYHDDFCLP